MNFWRETQYKAFLIEFPKYYYDASADYFPSGSLPSKLNVEEQKKLNQVIDLPKLVGCERELVLHELLKDRTKDKFTFYVLNKLELECEVNSYDKFKNTVFIEIAKRYFEGERFSSQYLILNLFKRGYKIKDEDNKFVVELYGKINTENNLEHWTVLRFATKLANLENINIAMGNLRELFTMLSFKMDRPISYNFPNLLGVAVNAITHYRESGDIILKSIERFNQADKIKKLDQRKGSFERKRLEYLENKPIQNKEFEKVAIKLFPELK